MRTAILLLTCFALSGLRAQAPSSLTGREYRGTGEAKFMEGCEGCDNPGHVAFEADNRVSYTLPGDDVIGSMTYVRKGTRITFTEGKWTMELKGDSLFFTAYDHRYTYLRV